MRTRPLLLVAVLLLAGGCTFEWEIEAGPPSPAASVGQGDVPAGTLDPSAAAGALLDLVVAEKSALDGYERGCGEGEGCVFGPAWSDVDRNGCDQRNDVLHRDLAEVEVREGTRGCVVVAGVLDDPYTGRTVPFEKATAAEVPVDHVVPLAAAWVQGAAGWTDARREEFANDLGNLLATTRSENSSKGDSTADEWVPPDPSYGCSYATVVITVKDRYALSVTAAEADALESLLATC
ncbi:HNH endonuclease family protein [Blastococcus sp. PRF04-17]|uniref:HNH endonuclease family protein n=1 Tax=Blastococcus sp. PRF04-17 TaxID=2933797 RepID=UPI001FF21D31|nr:HNH endonuclease family protein [Blastococcus sp. PRF04-17]UOY02716.1 HNH endonuclease family protein [Blastococcus sp. PRF04-17]